MKVKRIKPEFVEYIPDEIKDGVLYISIPFATATHRCACGCGERVVTPIRPTDWLLKWNGDEVSLYPSIGNWSIPCQSHYWIEDGKITWSKKWSNWEIEFGRKKDKKNKEEYFKTP